MKRILIPNLPDLDINPSERIQKLEECLSEFKIIFEKVKNGIVKDCRENIGCIFSGCTSLQDNRECVNVQDLTKQIELFELILEKQREKLKPQAVKRSA